MRIEAAEELRDVLLEKMKKQSRDWVTL